MKADGGDEGKNWGEEEEDTYLRLGAGVQDDRAIQTLVSLCWGGFFIFLFFISVFTKIYF